MMFELLHLIVLAEIFANFVRLLDFNPCPILTIHVKFARFFSSSLFVRTVTEWLIFAQTAHADPFGFISYLDLHRASSVFSY